MEVRWLIRKFTPDFKTIADFRKCNVDALKSLFHELTLFLAICSDDELMNIVTFLDGLKRLVIPH